MPVNNPCAAQLHACVLRATRLDASGAVITGATNSVVSSGLIKVDIGAEYQAGDEFTVQNGCGDICVQFKETDRLKRIKLSLEVCTPDPYLAEILTGGTLLGDTGPTVQGFAFPSTSTAAPPVSVEVWAKRIVNGAAEPSFPYNRWLFPRTEWTLTGISLEKGPASLKFEGFGIENTGWTGGGATYLWPAVAPNLVPSRVAQYMPVATIPTATCAYTVVS